MEGPEEQKMLEETGDVKLYRLSIRQTILKANEPEDWKEYALKLERYLMDNEGYIQI